VAAEAGPVAAPVDVDALQDGNQVEALEIRENVNREKERDYVTKVKLHTFAEEVLRNLEPPGGVHLTVVHRNEMSGGFQVVGIAYTLDGNPIYGKLDSTGALDERGQIGIFDSKVLPGDHQLAVQYDVRGTAMGLFTYLQNLTVVLRRTYNFKLEKGKETRLIGTLGTDDNISNLYENRPVVGFQTLAVDDDEKKEDKDKEKDKSGSSQDVPAAAPGDAAKAPGAAPSDAVTTPPASGK
jgi:hypothetical protein